MRWKIIYVYNYWEFWTVWNLIRTLSTFLTVYFLLQYISLFSNVEYIIYTNSKKHCKSIYVWRLGHRDNFHYVHILVASHSVSRFEERNCDG